MHALCPDTNKSLNGGTWSFLVGLTLALWCWQYLSSLLGTSIVTMFLFGVIYIELLHTELPVWAFSLSLAIGKYNMKTFWTLTLMLPALFYVIPTGMIRAITNHQPRVK